MSFVVNGIKSLWINPTLHKFHLPEQKEVKKVANMKKSQQKKVGKTLSRLIKNTIKVLFSWIQFFFTYKSKLSFLTNSKESRKMIVLNIVLKKIELEIEEKWDSFTPSFTPNFHLLKIFENVMGDDWYFL